MFSNDVPSYLIDLERSETERWREVMACEKTAALTLVREAEQEIARVPELVRWGFARLYQALGGPYQGEIAAWADAIGVSVGTVTILNCAYELSHLRWPKLLGCTAGVRWVEGLGLVHVRTLDWPLETMGQATRLFRFRRGPREYVSIGVPGQVSVLSGMVPGAYSVTINWAPPAALPSLNIGPAFLLREVLEDCAGYDAAVCMLTRTPLATSVFYTVCGIEQDQACVIERTQRQAVVRALTGPALTQANHHVAARFTANNEDLQDAVEGEEEFTLAGSSGRAQSLAQGLSALDGRCTLDSLARILDSPPVLNELTCQQMVFCPRTGEVKVWRRLPG